jgi:RNA polymerase sigma-70 factor (ECF subfamily)
MIRPEKTTEDIIRDLKQGRDEKENFRLLYNRYAGPIRGFFEKKGVTDCEELKDDVFLAVYKNLERFREESSFETWLFKIANNRYKNWLKQQRARKRIEVSPGGDREDMEEMGPAAPPTVGPEVEMLEKEKLEKVWEALQALPDQKRLVAILAWVDEQSPKEIASILPVSINTVYVHLHQAREILRERLREYFGDV